MSKTHNRFLSSISWTPFSFLNGTRNDKIHYKNIKSKKKQTHLYSWLSISAFILVASFPDYQYAIKRSLLNNSTAHSSKQASTVRCLYTISYRCIFSFTLLLFLIIKFFSQYDVCIIRNKNVTSWQASVACRWNDMSL